MVWSLVFIIYPLEACFIGAHTSELKSSLPLPKWAEARKISETDIISHLSSVIVMLRSAGLTTLSVTTACLCVFYY
jgi:hypothetical protein